MIRSVGFSEESRETIYYLEICRRIPGSLDSLEIQVSILIFIAQKLIFAMHKLFPTGLPFLARDIS